jgi:hypothetical protein
VIGDLPALPAIKPAAGNKALRSEGVVGRLPAGDFSLMSRLDWRSAIGVAQSIIANSKVGQSEGGAILRWGMAEADLDVLIRSIAKKSTKSLMEAARKRRAKYMAMAAKAANKDTRERHKQTAKNTLEFATAAAKRIQNSADNAADSYVRSMKHAAEQPPPKKPVKKPAKKSADKAAKAAS